METYSLKRKNFYKLLNSMKRLIFISLFFSLLFIQCKKETVEILSPFDVSLAITECRDNALVDSLEIAQNLLGEWKLAGYSCGLCVDTNSPESTIEFKQNTGTLAFRAFGGQPEVVEFTWHLEKVSLDIFNEPADIFQLVTEPSHEALPVNQYCADYIFYDSTPLDGPLFLYKKQ